MQTRHPALPEHRPLTSAHRGGNSIPEARHAIAIGCDLLETDVWYHHGRLELRHMHRLGSLPVLWERWKVRLDRTRLDLPTLLHAIDDEALLFLDLKGADLRLGPAIVAASRRHAPGRRVALCGRNYPQLDAVLEEPEVTIFYSVGEQREFAEVLPRLARMAWPAVSLHRKLATPECMRQLKELNATVLCWDVGTLAQARCLHELGVDGFTSHNLPLLARIARYRADALIAP